MAIPTGGGSEVLKRYATSGVNSTNVIAINGEADHIYTVLSIIICNKAASGSTCGINVQPDGSGEVSITGGTPATVPAYSTFVWNDKFVITGTDHLQIVWNGSDGDILVSYIEQDWT